MSEEVRVSVGELADGAATHIDGGPHGICVARLGGDFYAVADRCSHQNWPLSDGEVDGDGLTIECTKHGSTFSLKDGSSQCLPAVRPVPVYGVRVEGGEIVVTVT